ncbi:hypothetical protein H310_03418 [Aphanomyces invadans]|uniref:glutathione gamma-glutamylcysteinyltransferase n=1 Tax=Aphanomyces invadans TaxID=157072 RepID=A0A024UHM1_9STRA|nr:hypothetical protein H310_03418 [Aphanomyces invadans]ETW05705.1 hypothetical protein H310_03418 [Aphanomyces invadans]RHY29094.1 hypothetical protein DYB32_005445 [Aphanomyces invadans]|eukprot:XP_008865482.1 hypothetical protein H310_03418 [Aphanomyces invadans]
MPTSAATTNTAVEYVEPGHPAAHSHRAVRRAIMITIMSIVGYPVLLALAIFKYDFIVSVFSPASQSSIKKHPKYKDASLWARVWAAPVGQLYLRGNLEFQLQEGYCMPTTLRNVLKSIPTVNAKDIPEAKPGPSTPERYAAKIDAIGHTTSTVVFGSDGYDAFIAALKRANDPNYRVALNFLRSPVFGINSPSFVPHNLLLALAGGHFSNIVGYVEDEDLVAVFDVNHTYGPFFVESRRLYDAVNAHDFQSGKTRALIVSQLHKS